MLLQAHCENVKSRTPPYFGGIATSVIRRVQNGIQVVGSLSKGQRHSGAEIELHFPH